MPSETVRLPAILVITCSQPPVIARNQLQSQIIALQQTLLHIYEDIILNTDLPRHPPSFHLRQLARTARAARSASVEALATQYQRMLPCTESREPLALPGSFPASPITNSHETVVQGLRSSTQSQGCGSDTGSVPTVIVARRPTSPNSKPEARAKWSSNTSTSTKSVKCTSALRPSPTPSPVSSGLFCVYARDLQSSPSLSLPDNFKAGGDNRCPSCHTHIPSRPNKAWEMVKTDEKRKGVERTFLVGARFMVKCHRKGGGFACSLCSEYRVSDTVCSEVRALVEHLWKEHSCAELELDENIGEERS